MVRKLTGHMNLDCQVTVSRQTEPQEGLLVSIFTPENARFLIGKNGQNLRALEQVVRLMVLKLTGQPANVSLDVNDYRKEKALQVIQVARDAVSRVRNTRRAEALEPMTAYERRVVHMELAAYTDIVTESIGEEPQRRVVIKPFSI